MKAPIRALAKLIAMSAVSTAGLLPLAARAQDAPVGLRVTGTVSAAFNPGAASQVFYPSQSFTLEQAGLALAGDLSRSVDAQWPATGAAAATAQARSRAFFGDLGVYGQSWVADRPDAGLWQSTAEASAGFSDVWHMDAPGLAGTVGTLTLSVALDGSHTESQQNLFSTLRLNLYNNYGLGYRSDSLVDRWSGVFQLSVPFKFGGEVGNQVLMSLVGGVSAFNEFGGPFVSELDFYHSAKITKLTFSDAGGASVPLMGFSADSGQFYQAVPEPARFALLLSGIVLVGRVLRGREPGFGS